MNSGGIVIGSTGTALADDAVRGVVMHFESAFPNQVAAYYVEGSYADRSAVATSDLDLMIVFAAPPGSTEAARARQLVETSGQAGGPELDVTLTDEAALREQGDPLFKLGARLVYGREVRAGIPLMPIGEWARQRLHAAFWLMINVLARPQPVRAPLGYPQPGAPYYGYTERTLRLADGREIATTRSLVRVTGWIATARIAQEAGQYVSRKRECVTTYRQAIHDEWTPLLEQIDTRCRTAWQYRLPDQPDEQAELRAILAQTLAFENHFLGVYRDFVIAELTSGDERAQRMAVERLGYALLVDTEVKQALEHLATPQAEIRDKARALARQIDI